MSALPNRAERGIAYTFYSFKGGVGRSMALANVAALLAKWGRSVLVLDWDLEAPGIERFFTRDNEEAVRVRASKPGIVDLITERANGKEINWADCVHELRPNGSVLPVSLITAGRGGDDYTERMQSLDFVNLFANYGLGTYLETLRNDWITRFEFLLIDSRTGVTDIGGICTVHLADVLVLLFTATDSTTQGALEIMWRARKAQERLPLDRGRLLGVPLPARDESRTEYERAAEWKKIFASRFEDLYSDWLPSGITPEQAVDTLRIPYVPYWSFGERLPAIEEGTSDPASLGFSYQILARLLATRLDWYAALEGQTLAPPPVRRPRALSFEWIDRHHHRAFEGLTRSGKSGFMEIYHLCFDDSLAYPARELPKAARQAMVETSGWPIGVVLDNEKDRPGAAKDGIVAEINATSLTGGQRYDYWTLTSKGDFYALMSLAEDDDGEKKVINRDFRILKTTEAILHCRKLYKVLGADPNASVELTIRYEGLRGRLLSLPSRIASSLTDKLNRYEDEVSATASFRVAIADAEVPRLVRNLCEPLFNLFDFATFTESIYERIVSNFIAGRL